MKNPSFGTMGGQSLNDTNQPGDTTFFHLDFVTKKGNNILSSRAKIPIV